MAKRSWIILVLLVFLLSGCASAQATPSLRSLEGPSAATPAMAAPAPQSLTDKGSGGATNSSLSPATTTSADAQRLVIMNASLSIVVPDPAATMDFINPRQEYAGVCGFIQPL